MRKLIDNHPHSVAVGVVISGLIALLWYGGLFGIVPLPETFETPQRDRAAAPAALSAPIEAPSAAPVLLGATIVLRWQVAPGVVATSRLVVDPKSIAQGQRLEALRCGDALDLPVR